MEMRKVAPQVKKELFDLLHTYFRKEERSFFCYKFAISKNSVWRQVETLIIIISNTIFFFGIYYKNFFWNLL